MESLKEVSDYFGFEVDIPLDGTIYRFGKKKEFWAVGNKWVYKNNDYWQVKYGNFKEAYQSTRSLNSWEGKELTKNESASISSRSRDLNIKIEADRQEKYKIARITWGTIFKMLPKEYPLHDYCSLKGLSSNFVARVSDITIEDSHLYKGTLCVPVYNIDGDITGVQRIYKNKENKFEKRYCQGLELKGSICPIGSIKNAETVYVCEGFATGASINMAIGKPVVVCFQASNILNSIQTLRKINPSCSIIICADRDLNSGNVGEKKALEAKDKIPNVMVKVASFKEGDDSLSDFNDIHMSYGLEEVSNQLEIDQSKMKENLFAYDIKTGFTETDDKGKSIRQYARLLEYLKFKHKLKFIESQGKFLAWQGTHYEEISDQWIKAFAQTHFNYPICFIENQRKEFLNLVKASSFTSPDFFDSRHTKGLINLKNGVYDYINDKLLPHDSKYPFMQTIQVDYDKDAICPFWDQLMQNVLCLRMHLHMAVEEFMGFIISGMDYSKYNKTLIFDGSGSNGKSTVIWAIQELCGKSNCSSISVARVSSNRFLTSEMQGKLVNFSEEEPKSLFAESGVFKQLTGGSPMFAEKKGKQGFLIENRAKLVMSYNEMPHIPDTSAGMKRRLLIIPFDLNLEKEDNKKILHIKERLEKEMPGILLAAIAGLKRLIKNHGFTDVPESDVKMEEMITESDDVREWFKESVIFTGKKEDQTPLYELYSSYKYFLGTSNPTINKNVLSRKTNEILRELGMEETGKKIYISGHRVNFKFGVKLNTEKTV